jgi:hypothetical protein
VGHGAEEPNAVVQLGSGAQTVFNLLPLFNMSYSVGQIHKYSVKLYQELEAETG